MSRTEQKIQVDDIASIVSGIGTEKRSVIPILQAIQEKYNFLPEDALRTVSDLSDITLEQILGVASFYSQFRLEPVGEHMVKVCVGTACHVKGSALVHDALRREMKLDKGVSTDSTGKYTLEKVNCLGCCTLAPVVQIDNITYGHVASDKVGDIISDFERIRHTKGKSQYRSVDGKKIDGEIRIGLGSCCVASGSDDIRQAVEETVQQRGLNVNLKHVGCVGMCHQVPLVEIVPDQKEATLYAKVSPDSVKGIIDQHFSPPGLLKRLKNKLADTIENIQNDDGWEGIERYQLDVREKQVSSFLGHQVLIATEFRGIINPLDIEEYIYRGGFTALGNVFRTFSPDELIRTVKASGIRGRGGACFPTGEKWERVAGQDNPTKYIICNGDEGDPGAFMDRMLLESYPYRIIEGMLIAAFAVGASEGYFYIRAEYPLAVSRIRQALQVCRDKGYLGRDIMKSGFSIDLHLFEGAGAFVCGEETALIASIEGNRGNPRLRPPYPAEKGLWGHPTLVNNAETYAQIAYIIRNGPEKYNAIGSTDCRGTKVFALAGKIARGGLIEVPMGITIRKIVEEIGGGVAGGLAFKAVQIGGPSGGCIPASMADIPVDLGSLSEAGAMIGSGGMVVLDETDCMVDIARYFLSFTQKESCGKCTFCRIGTRRMLDILERLCAGRGETGDLEKLEELAGLTKRGSLCGLGRTAPNPVLTTLRYFRDEYEAHLEGRCPAGRCQELITYSINDECIGCTLCSQSCPADAIRFNPHEKHEIQQDKCIKCDSCRQVCPVEAVNIQ
jgi:NADH:ubiquinone oxidoreductase subunit F (NADH-binding)/NADH:ubiquinone oxidoreductase subunit E